MGGVVKARKQTNNLYSFTSLFFQIYSRVKSFKLATSELKSRDAREGTCQSPNYLMIKYCLLLLLRTRGEFISLCVEWASEIFSVKYYLTPPPGHKGPMKGFI